MGTETKVYFKEYKLTSSPEPVFAEGTTESEISLLSGGWNKRRLKTSFDYGKEPEREVSLFKAQVPEFGTYKVEVTLRSGKDKVRGLTLFAGRRNIVASDVCVDGTFSNTFYVAVTPYIPALTSERNNDKNIFVSWTHKSLIESADIRITRQEVPVIWVAGDSTLTDQNAGIPYYPFGSCCGWAQTIARFTSKAAVCNLSHSGMTSNCFRDDGHYAIAKEFMKEGDYFIIQFGHNDQKRRNLAARGGYSENIERYIKEVIDLGVQPILCSPISRIPLKLTEDEANKLGADRFYSLLSSYADACKDIAAKTEVPFVDLHGFTFEKWKEFGDKASDFFMMGDITHKECFCWREMCPHCQIRKAYSGTEKL